MSIHLSSLSELAKEAKEKIIEMQSLIQAFPGIVMAKDICSKYVACNDGFVDLLKFKHQQEILGKNDYQLPWADFADIYIGYDKQLFETGKKITALIPMLIQDGTLLISKSSSKPIVNSKGKVLGLIGTNEIQSKNQLSSTLQLLTNLDSRKYSQDLKQLSYNVIENFEEYNLGKRELECLFFILRGKTAKEIGPVLHLSFRTVEYYVEQLKVKFGCVSKSQLIGKAIDAGFINIIPSTLSPETIEKAL